MDYHIVIYLLLGLAAGALSGLVGIGGGVLVIPALVLILGYNQHLAQGTTLAMMVPPIGFLAAWTYFKQGNVDLKAAGLMCVGFFIGGLFGAKLAQGLSNAVLQKLFGAVLLAVALKLIFK